MILIKRFEQYECGWDYDLILKLISADGWKMGSLQYAEDFENNDEYFKNIQDESDYATNFHIYLTDLKLGQLRGTLNMKPSLKMGKWTGQPKVAEPISIYRKFI